MKKILMLIVGILMISDIANACGGTTINGKSGTEYCLSNRSMNWYTAYAWCDGQGMKLIDVEDVCGTITGGCSELNLGLSISAWTNTSSAAKDAYDIYLKNGSINGFGSHRYTRAINGYRALCK